MYIQLIQYFEIGSVSQKSKHNLQVPQPHHTLFSPDLVKLYSLNLEKARAEHTTQ